MIQHLRRGAAALLLAAVALPGGVVLARTGPATGLCAEAASVNHAAVQVEHSDGRIAAACVNFTDSTINATTLLQGSGIAFRTSSAYSGSGVGAAICQVDGEPAQYPPDCFSGMADYWELLVAHNGGTWQVAARGISTLTITAGDAFGLHYVPQSGGSGMPPSPWSICSGIVESLPSTTAASVPVVPGATTGRTTPPTASAAGGPVLAPTATHSPQITAAVQALTTTPVATQSAPPTAPVDLTALITCAVGGGLAGLLLLQIRRQRAP